MGCGIFAHRLLYGAESGRGSGPSPGERVGYYVAPPSAFVAVFVCALWAIRNLSSGYVLNGFLVGLVSVLLTLGFVFGARPEHRLMYGVSFCSGLLAEFWPVPLRRVGKEAI